MTQAIAKAKKQPHAAIIEDQVARYETARRFIDEEGIAIKHFRPAILSHAGVSMRHNGGMTVAFRKLDTDSFVEISTAMCSQHDVYNRKVGTTLAVEQFMNQRRIRVPVHGNHPAEVVEQLFREINTFEAAH